MVKADESWSRWVHDPQTPAEGALFKTHIVRGVRWEMHKWIQETAARLGLKHALRPPGQQPGSRQSMKRKYSLKGQPIASRLIPQKNAKKPMFVKVKR